MKKYKKFETRASLQTLKRQRNKILCESLGTGCDIYMGLHKSGKERMLHFDKYIITWLDEHWNIFCDLCDENKKEYSEYQRNEIANNFAKTFMEMLVGVEIQQSFSKAEITLKCIKLKKQYLNELLNFAMKNRQNIEMLKLETTKHEDWFQKEIEKLQL